MRGPCAAGLLALAMVFADPVSAETVGAETISAQPADPEKGARVFKKCRACHKVGPEARHGVGPALNGIVGAPFGAAVGYKYSRNLRQLAEEGLVWDEETLDAYLTRPKSVIPKGKMAFAGLRKAKDRANVIEFLRQFALD